MTNLKTVFLVLIFGSLAHANSNTSSIAFDYTFQEQSFLDGAAKNHELGFEFKKVTEHRQSLWLRGQMVGTSYNSDLGSQKTGYGLGDFHLGSRSQSEYDMFNLTYGINGSISPGMARNPRWGQVSQINSFSGYHTLAPTVGFETYNGPLFFGFEAEVRLYSDIRFEDQGEAITATNPNYFIPKIRGFAQVPVVRGIEFGLQGAISRNNFSLDQLLLGSPGNQYEAEIYGLGEIDQKTQLILSFNAKNLRYPLIEDSTNFMVGLRLDQ